MIFEDNRVKALRPDETAPYEERGIKNLDRINQKIAELQKLSPESLMLNDRAPQK